MRSWIRWQDSLWPSSGDGESPWRPWGGWVEWFLPYALLSLSTVLSLLISGQDPAVTLGLAGLAAGWLLVSTTLVPSRWAEHPVVVAVSFTGLVTAAAVLEAHDTVFLIFMITGFFEAMRLRPAPLALTGIFVVSALINTIPNGGPLSAFADQPALWTVVTLVQTAAVGGGGLVSAAMARQHAERKRVLDELAAAQEENAGLQRQLLGQARETGILDERQRLSQEIHDTLAQGFTGIITQLEAAAAAKGDPAEWQRHVDTAMALARENLTAARRSVRALGPQPLAASTLPDALDEVSRLWSGRTGVEIRFTTTGTARALHPEIEATLLRVTQEALTNVEKHAAATIVGLTLSYMADQVTVDVRDDGGGFDPGAAVSPGEGGFGVPGMRARVTRLAGTLNLESEPGGGTAVSANLPAIALEART
ncbi:two-component sensor histidine kinase [Amycolatopsis coloradensis]|uniref:Two-component sensor histidine kinase n=1 Tax=Amycolatopsis coloradensis TaxID=76021 RepID=A0A1R0KYK6_9PSEU|nr:sensor histidine kinase [Amycolatopsis coloradensis]OLZ54403.1 two-component sensor histidine kinase [Amycolatopsis coloradensis]